MTRQNYTIIMHLKFKATRLSNLCTVLCGLTDQTSTLLELRIYRITKIKLHSAKWRLLKSYDGH